MNKHHKKVMKRQSNAKIANITIFWAFLHFFGDLCHALWPKSNTRTGQNARHESPKKKKKCPKKGYFD